MSAAGRAMVVDDTVVVVVAGEVVDEARPVELPQAASVMVMLTAAARALMKVLVFMSACLSGDGCAGADRVDDVADRLAGLGGGGLLRDEHVVVSVHQRAMNAVGRQRGELVLRGRPSAFSALLRGQDDEGVI